MELTTERLRLRPLRREDAEGLFAIFSNPEVMRFWSTPPWPSIEEAHRMIEGDLASMASEDYLRLGVERRADGALVGVASLFDHLPGCRRAEVGYGLAREAWGRGYMHEALVALLHYGFEALDLNRVEADIDPRNRASARTLERLGFRQEGLLRERWIVNGEISDSALYGLLRRDWFDRFPERS